MNHKRYTYNILLLLGALLLFGCSQEDMPGAAGRTDDSEILFRVSMPASRSRSATTMAANLKEDGFHVTAFCPEDDVTGTLPYFFEERFVTPLEENPDLFGILVDPLSEEPELCVWPSSRHSKRGQLKFFAFYPSRETMRQSAGATSDDFGLENQSTKNGSTVKYDYRMKKFKVNKAIPDHIDFVTATTYGSKLDNGATGVQLDFEHQLSRIALTAWGNTGNDIEIVGVRIGCAVVESDFNFAATPLNLAQGDATRYGGWVSSTMVRDCVEYIFREGDTVVKIGSGSHTSADAAASIMGNGGCAMVIPADNPRWNYTNDASNSNKGLYFSVLLRVKENDENKTLVYPYVAGGSLSATISTDAMTVIFMAVYRETGQIVKRLYRNTDGNYFTDPGFTDAYTQPETEEIRNYSWAAIPLSTTIRWKPGYQYTYTLNYSNGVGVHDPDDPYPGKPIISTILVGVTENGKTWPMVYDFTEYEGGEVDVTDQIVIE